MKKVIITPSYGPDFERCKLLCESVQKYVSNYEKHILIVDERDVETFRCLENDKTQIISKESTFEWELKNIPGSRKWWYSFRTMPLRGWILQQIIKLSVAEFIDADVYIFADSDMIFIRSFDTDSLVHDDKVALFSPPRLESTYHEPRHQNWYRLAGKILGLKDSNYLHTEYISQINCWRRDTLEALYVHMNDYFGKYWKEALCNRLDLSEYILYGAFAEDVLGTDSGHFKITDELAFCSWHHPIHHRSDIQTFLGSVPPNYVAVHIQSNLGIESEYYRDQIHLLQASQ